MAEKILVVDDEREIADLVALYLKNEGYETLVCYNGPEALEQIQAGPVDLAILDVMLPELSGFALCRRIRERYQYPVIMLTAKGEELDKINRLVPGGGRLRHQALPPPGAGSRVKGPAAAVQTLQRGSSPERAPHLRGPGHRRGDPSGLPQRRALVPDTPPNSPCWPPSAKTRGRWSPRRSCSAVFGERTTTPRTTTPSPCTSGIFGKSWGTPSSAPSTSKPCGGSAMKWTRKYGPLAAGCLSLLAVSLVLYFLLDTVFNGCLWTGWRAPSCSPGRNMSPRPGLTASYSTSTGIGSSPSYWECWWSTACCGPGRCSSPASWPAGRKSGRTPRTSPSGCARPWIPMGTPARSFLLSSRRSPPRWRSGKASSSAGNRLSSRRPPGKTT